MHLTVGTTSRIKPLSMVSMDRGPLGLGLGPQSRPQGRKRSFYPNTPLSEAFAWSTCPMPASLQRQERERRLCFSKEDILELLIIRSHCKVTL